jgi:hypothetical protein
MYYIYRTGHDRSFEESYYNFYTTKGVSSSIILLRINALKFNIGFLYFHRSITFPLK